MPTPSPPPPTPPLSDLGDGIWLHHGLSNTYLIQTDDGRVVVNTGMGFEGPLHRRAYDDVDPSPTRAVILTQGHYDHVGGIDVLRDPDSDVIAQANYDVWRQDNARLEAFRSRNSAFAWISAIVAAMEYARSVGVGDVAMATPDADGHRRRAPRADRRRTGARAHRHPRRRDVRLTGGLAPRDPHPAERQPLRAAVRARPEPGHHPGRPLPRRTDLHPLPRHRARSCSRSGS